MAYQLNMCLPAIINPSLTQNLPKIVNKFINVNKGFHSLKNVVNNFILDKIDLLLNTADKTQMQQHIFNVNL